MNQIYKKSAWLLALVGLFMFSGVALFQLQMAFGFGTPSGPPGSSNGAIAANPSGQVMIGNVGGLAIPATLPAQVVINGNPAVDTVGSDIIGLPGVPSGDTAAASKLYVDNAVLAAGGGGAGAIITLFGVSWNSPLSNPNNESLPAPYGLTRTGMAYTIAQCIRGNLGACASLPGTGSGVTAGTGTPSCPTGFSEVYAGYGPHSFNMSSYYDVAPVAGAKDGQASTGLTSGDEMDATGPWETWRPSNSIMGTYSICSTSKFEIVQNNWSALVGAGGQGVMGNTVGVATACGPNDPLAGAGTYEACNTCRVCIKD